MNIHILKKIVEGEVYAKHKFTKSELRSLSVENFDDFEHPNLDKILP